MPAERDLSVIIVAAGSGQRFAKRDKILAPLGGIPLLAHSIQLFNQIEAVCELVVVLADHTRESGSQVIQQYSEKPWKIAAGGVTRSASVASGLATLAADAGLVAVHDAARPLTSPSLVHRLLNAARERGAALPVVQLSDSVLAVADAGRQPESVDRSTLRAVQTPQIARRTWLEDALSRAPDQTDEGAALLACGYPVALVDGELTNLKITWPPDLAVAEALIAHQEASSV